MGRDRAAICRDLLKQLETMTYLVTDEEGFNDLENSLRASIQNLSEHVTSDHGIILEKPVPKRSKVAYTRLPKPKRKRSNLSGRVGIGAENKRKRQKLSVNPAKLANL